MKIIRIVKNIIYSLLNKKTVGARALVISDNKVLLVQHTYMDGAWYTIGGAVDPGESPKQAIIRELHEEVGIEVKKISLFNVYHSAAEGRDDYIVFFICKEFTENSNISVSEIKAKQWFNFDELPSDISPATFRRIQEYRGAVEASDGW